MHIFRETLRARTFAAHAAIDARFGALNLAGRTDYVRFLRAQSAALPGLEAETARLCGAVEGLDLDARTRMAALRDDLADLDAAPAPPLPAPVLPCAAAGLGALYVLEGSRLGARVLIGRVQASADPDVARATRYLGHGDPRLWPEFLEIAAARLQDEAELEAACDGALSAFAAFERAADRCLPALHPDAYARG